MRNIEHPRLLTQAGPIGLSQPLHILPAQYAETSGNLLSLHFGLDSPAKPTTSLPRLPTLTAAFLIPRLAAL